MADFFLWLGSFSLVSYVVSLACVVVVAVFLVSSKKADQKIEQKKAPEFENEVPLTIVFGSQTGNGESK